MVLKKLKWYYIFPSALRLVLVFEFIAISYFPAFFCTADSPPFAFVLRL